MCWVRVCPVFAALILPGHKETGISVVLVCHELEVIPPACRRVTLLDPGRVLASGSLESVFTTEQVSPPSHSVDVIIFKESLLHSPS
jgi:ABC-type methionine transport system ATPase subunit